MRRRVLVVDGQIFQTPAWDRGMGKYSLELFAALTDLNKEEGYWESISVILSERMPESVDNVPVESEVISAIERRVPDAKIVRLKLKPNEVGNRAVPQTNRAIIDTYIGTLIDGNEMSVDFLIPSLLQSEIRPVFPSSPRVHKHLLHHDLIPLIFHRTYLGSPFVQKAYFSKFEELFKADCFLGNSKLTCNDLALHLGISRDRIATIDGGPIPHAMREKEVSIPSPFIFMPTGNDVRKNNERGIRGFVTFNAQHNNRYTLAITGFFKQQERDELSQLGPNIQFVGNVSGEEMNYLYEHAKAILFPPEYEGLGLPVLEAVEHYKPIACSDIAVFRELSDTDFEYFNHLQVADIADALHTVTSPNYSVKKKGYQRILEEYTWQQTAKKAVTAMFASEAIATDASKPRIAIFGPDPACGFGVGKYLQEGHGELARYFTVDYFFEYRDAQEANPRLNLLPFVSNTLDITEQTTIDVTPYKAALYHLSNDDMHAKTLFTALAVPGVAVLHDLNLENVWQQMLSAGLIDQSRWQLENRIEQKYGTKGTSHIISLVANQRAVIVFNADAKRILEQLLEKLGKDVPVFQLALPTTEVVYEEILPPKDHTVGVVLREKQALEAFIRLACGDYEKTAVSSLAAKTFDITIPDNIAFSDNATDFDYLDCLSRLELFYSAEPGQQMLNILDAMKFSVLPVTDNHAVRELPDNCTVTVGPKEELTSKVQAIGKTRQDMQTNSRLYAASHTYHSQAASLWNIISSIM